MATRAAAMTITYIAWDTGANAPKTGDAANHTLRWVKDGTAAAPTNGPQEVDATNAPGVYRLALTATETDCNIGTLAGKSSTSGVVLIPTTIQFERLPDAAPGASGGVARVQDVPTASSVASAVWSATTRTLTSFGSLVSDIWAHATRSLTDKSGYSLTSDYDAAKTAAQPDDIPSASSIASEVWSATSRALTDKSGFSLTSEYDAAKTAASQASVDAVGDNVEAIKTKTDALEFGSSGVVAEATVDAEAVAGALVEAGVASEATVQAVKAKTDNLAFTSGRVNAKLDVIVESQIYQTWDAAIRVDSRLTGQRAANLDNLDAAVSSRLAADAYVYPANDDIAAIKAKTDKLQFAGNDVKATLDGEQVIVSQNNDKTGYSLAQAYEAAKVAASQSSVDAIHAKLTTQRAANLDNLDAAVTSRLAASEYVAPANSDIAAIKAATDRIRFNSSDDVIATTDGEVVAVDIDGDALAVAVDSRLSQTHGPGAWGAAMPEDVTITHQSLDTYGNAIGTTWPYAIISVYLESDDYREQKLRQGVANPDGTFAINIAAGATYRIVFTKDTEGEREAVVNV